MKNLQQNSLLNVTKNEGHSQSLNKSTPPALTFLKVKNRNESSMYGLSHYKSCQHAIHVFSIFIISLFFTFWLNCPKVNAQNFATINDNSGLIIVQSTVTKSKTLSDKGSKLATVYYTQSSNTLYLYDNNSKNTIVVEQGNNLFVYHQRYAPSCSTQDYEYNELFCKHFNEFEADMNTAGNVVIGYYSQSGVDYFYNIKIYIGNQLLQSAQYNLTNGIDLSQATTAGYIINQPPVCKLAINDNNTVVFIHQDANSIHNNLNSEYQIDLFNALQINSTPTTSNLKDFSTITPTQVPFAFSGSTACGSSIPFPFPDTKLALIDFNNNNEIAMVFLEIGLTVSDVISGFDFLETGLAVLKTDNTGNLSTGCNAYWYDLLYNDDPAKYSHSPSCSESNWLASNPDALPVNHKSRAYPLKSNFNLEFKKQSPSDFLLTYFSSNVYLMDYLSSSRTNGQIGGNSWQACTIFGRHIMKEDFINGNASTSNYDATNGNQIKAATDITPSLMDNSYSVTSNGVTTYYQNSIIGDNYSSYNVPSNLSTAITENDNLMIAVNYADATNGNANQLYSGFYNVAQQNYVAEQNLQHDYSYSTNAAIHECSNIVGFFNQNTSYNFGSYVHHINNSNNYSFTNYSSSTPLSTSVSNQTFYLTGSNYFDGTYIQYNNCTFLMAEGTKLKIKPKTTVEFSGCTFDALGDCNTAMWNGMEIDQKASVYLDGCQFNNARYGVKDYLTDDNVAFNFNALTDEAELSNSPSSGSWVGQLNAYKTTFQNCYQSINFKSTALSKPIIHNLSADQIQKCQFLCTANMNDKLAYPDGLFQHMIKLDRVDGAEVLDCGFVDNYHNNQDYFDAASGQMKNNNTGIKAVDAVFTVHDLTGQKNTFTNLCIGIDACGISTARGNVAINNCVVNESGEIGFSFASASDFNVDHNLFTNSINSNTLGWGICGFGATTLSIEKNEFTQTGYPLFVSTCGATTAATASFVGNNYLHNNSAGLWTQGGNKNLTVDCNEFAQSTTTHWIHGDDIAVLGNCSQQPIGNRWDDNPTAYNHIYLDVVNNFGANLNLNYNCYPDQGNYTFVPVINNNGINGYNVNAPGCNGRTIPTNYATDCKAGRFRLGHKSLDEWNNAVLAANEYADKVDAVNGLTDETVYQYSTATIQEQINYPLHQRMIDALSPYADQTFVQWQLLPEYVMSNQFEPAQEISNNITTANDIEHATLGYYNLLINAGISGRWASNLTADELSAVKNIAASNLPVSYQAKALLHFYYNQPLIPPTYSFDNNARKANKAMSSESNDRFIPQLLTLYPNPAKDEVTLQFSNTTSSDMVSIAIIDLLGRTMLQQNLSLQNGKYIISTNVLQDGIYTCKVFANGSLLDTKKLVIVK